VASLCSIVVPLMVRGYMYVNTVQNSNLSGSIDFSSENCLWVYDIRRKFKEKKG